MFCQDVFYVNSSDGGVDIKPDSHRRLSNKPKIPAVFLYDPTGLRVTNTATWDEMEKSVILHALPVHLPKVFDEVAYKQTLADCERKNIPPPVGPRYKWKRVSSNFNQVRW